MSDCRCAVCACCEHDHRGWNHEWEPKERDVEQQPTVGRIVHYVSYGTPGGEYTSQCRAAIITEVSDGIESDRRAEVVSLAVLNPTGMFFSAGCRHEEPYDGEVHPGHSRVSGGTWHWPERV